MSSNRVRIINKANVALFIYSNLAPAITLNQSDNMMTTDDKKKIIINNNNNNFEAMKYNKIILQCGTFVEWREQSTERGIEKDIEKKDDMNSTIAGKQ